MGRIEVDLAGLDRRQDSAHRKRVTRQPDLNQIPRNRRDLVAQYPGLGGALPLQHRLADECLEILGIFSRFCREITPDVLALDSDESPQHRDARSAVLTAACRHRIFSLSMPKSLGGSGYSMLALSVGLEHLSRTCVGIANLVAAHGLALAIVGATGNVRMLRMLAGKIIAGELDGRAFLLATAATEPSAGSDIEDYAALEHATFESCAALEGTSWALSGRKVFVSNGNIASAYVVIMPTDRASPRETLSAFLVPADTPGAAVVRVERKLGQRACPAAELRFERCVIPGELRLNEGTIAGRVLDLVLGSSRATLGAFGAGVAWGVWEKSRFLAERPSMRGSGTPLLEHPSARALLARMWSNATLGRDAYLGAAQIQRHCGLISLMESETLRALDRIVPSRLTHHPLADKLLGWQGIDREARRLLTHMSERDIATASAIGSATKIQTSELALQNCRLALELLGIEATREDSGIPKYWRDARLLSIYEGTNEICALDVAQKTSARPA